MHLDLYSLGACDASKIYYNTEESFESAWANCPRGDWMLWLARKLTVDKHILTLTVSYCTKTFYHLLVDERSKDLVVAGINFGRNLITEEELYTAYCHAYSAVRQFIEISNNLIANHQYDKETKDITNTAIAALSIYRYPKFIFSENEMDYGDKNQRLIVKICHKYLTTAVFEKVKQLQK